MDLTSLVALIEMDKTYTIGIRSRDPILRQSLDPERAARNISPRSYSIAFTTALGASLTLPSNPVTPPTVVYFITYFLSGKMRW